MAITITVGFNDVYDMLSAAVALDNTVFIAYFLWTADLTKFIKSYRNVTVIFNPSLSQSLRQMISSDLEQH